MRHRQRFLKSLGQIQHALATTHIDIEDRDRAELLEFRAHRATDRKFDPFERRERRAQHGELGRLHASKPDLEDDRAPIRAVGHRGVDRPFVEPGDDMAGGVARQADIVAHNVEMQGRHAPVGAGRLIDDGHVGIRDADAGQVARGLALIGRAIEAFGHDREELAKGFRGCGIVRRLLGVDADRAILAPDQLELGRNDLKAGRRDHAAKQRRPADSERDLRDGDHLRIGGIVNCSSGSADIHGAVPTAPGQHRVLDIDPVAAFRPEMQRLGDPGRQERQRNRPRREPPSQQREPDHDQQQQGAEALEEEFRGRFNHNGGLFSVPAVYLAETRSSFGLTRAGAFPSV